MIFFMLTLLVTIGVGLIWMILDKIALIGRKRRLKTGKGLCPLAERRASKTDK